MRRALAAAADVQPAAIYHWYPSKEAILIHLQDDFMEQLTARVTAAIGSGNATLAGWQGNAELWSVMRGDTNSFPVPLVELAGWLRGLPDLVVLDILMPRVDGLELCRRLRGRSEALPIIFLTSRDEELELTPEIATEVMIQMSDPRSRHFGKMRHETLPADHIFGRRVEMLTLAVLGQLRATNNWHRIAREWLFGDPPSTELGVLEEPFHTR